MPTLRLTRTEQQHKHRQENFVPGVVTRRDTEACSKNGDGQRRGQGGRASGLIFNIPDYMLCLQLGFSLEIVI
jgi:hypothetical protein